MSNLLKLDSNERSDLETSSLIEDFVESTKSQKSFWRYPNREPLEKQIAQLNGLVPEQVLCTNGGDEAIMLLMRIIKEGYQLILPLPAFSQYTWGVDSWRIATAFVAPNDDLTINLDCIVEKIRCTTNSVTIITRPNNPTGEAISIKSVSKIIETASLNNGWVFIDEAYAEFMDDIDKTQRLNYQQLLKRYDNIVVLRTLSKAFGLAGIRIGYLLGSEKLISEFTNRCLPFNISQPSLNIAQIALYEKNRKEVESYSMRIISNRQLVSAWLIEKNISVVPSQGNFVLLSLPNNQALAIKSFLSRNDILVRGFKEKSLNNCLRITIPFNLDKLFPLLKQALSPELICFDMDGVLIDTSQSYDQTVLATVKELSGKSAESEQIDALRCLGGYNNDWKLSQQLLSNLNVQVDIEKVIEVFQRIYLGNNNDGLMMNERPIISNDLVKKILDHTQRNFAIVTGRPKKEGQIGQALAGLSKLDLISLDDVIEGKPSPEGIRKLQSKYSTSSWMCGDNSDDMLAAISSQSLAIGISENNKSTLYKAGADIVLDNINELEKWL